jgi:hypothetical protein
MRERRSQIVLLVRAFEEVDRDYRVLPEHARTVATRRALRVTGLTNWPGELTEAHNFRNGEVVARRARLLYDGLRRSVPPVRGVLRMARLGSGTAPTIIVTAFVLGLLTNVLGPYRQISLLSFPLLGLLAWNFAVYVALLLTTVFRALTRRRRGGAGARHGLVVYLASVFMKGALWRRLHGWHMAQSLSKEKASITSKAFVRFGAMWYRLAGPVLAARVRRLLHLGAAAMVVGALFGMYVRGLVLEYRVMWESTLLDAEQVQTLLNVILGPAAALLGVSVPDVAPLRGPGPGAGGDAALWIHLYAVTALLFVVVPRALLGSYQRWRGRRLAARIPVDLSDSYYRRIFVEWRGAQRRIDVIPYSFRQSPEMLYRMKTLLYEYFGARADIRVGEPLAYGAGVPEGDDASDLDAPENADDDVVPGEERCVVLVFNLAQTPESEVHGAFLNEVLHRIESHRWRLLVLVDSSTYRERIDSAERRRERFETWSRLVGDAGLSAVDLDPDPPADERLLDEVRAGIWPGSEPVGAG